MVFGLLMRFSAKNFDKTSQKQQPVNIAVLSFYFRVKGDIILLLK